MANLDFTALWAFLLILSRLAGVFSTLPGIGSESLPRTPRFIAAMIIAITPVAAGLRVELPENIVHAGFAVGVEFVLGFLLGSIPQYIISSVAVSGQVVAGVIGLGQANMIDPSLGESVSVIARMQSFFATIVFLILNGHHIVIRVATGVLADIQLGAFRPGTGVAELLLDRMAETFTLALIVSAPILVTVLVAQFVLGLITRFIPQVNIFIVSLPLSVLMGLYIIGFTFSGETGHLIAQFSKLEELLVRIVTMS